jgi:DNA-binding NtrC family response regulator
VFVCDCDNARRHALSSILSTDYHVQQFSSVSSLGDRHAGPDPSLVLIGFGQAEERQAFAAVERLRLADHRIPVVLIAQNSSEAVAVAALRAGANDYFAEPVAYSAVAESVCRHLSSKDARAAGIGPPETVIPASRLIGPSASMRSVDEYLTRAASRDVTVLITGETGTGKELAAALVHSRSARRHARLVSVNCAAIPDGLLESELFGYESGAFTGAAGRREGLLQLADRGTVFLDEVGDLALTAQAKILRAIETREVYRVGGKKPIPLDIRVVAATNHDLETACDQGRFRKDLYFRLNVARVHLPPLRNRPADIVALADHYLQELNTRFGEQVEGFSPEVLDTLKTYDWPGNVRELKNLLEAIFICPPGRLVRIEDLPEPFRHRLRSICSLPPDERQCLIEALVGAKWNKSEAAKQLHWSRMTVYRKIAKYAVVKSDLRRVTPRDAPVTPSNASAPEGPSRDRLTRL